MRALSLLALAMLAMPARAALAKRRLGFVASTNAGSSSFQPLADLMIAHAASWNVAHAYCSSPGEITNATVLPTPPFCYNNWTLPIRAAAPHIEHVPIIQMLGNSGPLNFAHPYIFAAKYVEWAERYNFSGYLLDAEFKGDDGAFEGFLTVFADALHAVNKTLGVFLYPDLGKKNYVNRSTADYCACLAARSLPFWLRVSLSLPPPPCSTARAFVSLSLAPGLGTWGGKCDTIPGFIWACNPYWGRGGMMLYQRDAACTGSGIDKMFSTWGESRMEETSFWANGADMGDSWYGAMEAFLNASRAEEAVAGPPEAAPAPATLPPSAPAPAWPYSGFARFPSFYFGADESGPQPPKQVALVARFALAGWGWQQGFSRGHGEAQGVAAAEAVRRVAPAGGAPGAAPDALFVYRQSESLFTYYDAFAALARNASLAAAASLADPVSGKLCGGGGLLAYGNATFAEYWVRAVGGELAGEAPLVRAVFYDGYDKLYAGGTLAEEGCSGFTPAATARELRAKVAATAAQAAALNANGSLPLLSTYNYLQAAAEGLEGVEAGGAGAPLRAMNGVYEDEYLAALAGVAWARFYEVWLGHGPAQDALMIQNAILEGAAGVPFVARSDPKTMHSLEYGALGFLIAQAHHCYWGASSGWLDSDWPWRGILDWKVGAPLGNATRVGSFAWSRRFEHANVSVDTKAGLAEVAWEGGELQSFAR
jgi:hypothetical protein